MRRGYTASQFLETVEKARSMLDNPAITTDVMVGFPGETDEQFENTLRLCQRVAFSRIHVFPFSPRPGTAAASMPDRVDKNIVKERCRRLGRLAVQLARRWAGAFVGTEVRVLFEEHNGGCLTGYTDRYVRLRAPGPRQYVGKTVRLRCVALKDGTLLGGTLYPGTEEESGRPHPQDYAKAE